MVKNNNNFASRAFPEHNKSSARFKVDFRGKYQSFYKIQVHLLGDRVIARTRSGRSIEVSLGISPNFTQEFHPGIRSIPHAEVGEDFRSNLQPHSWPRFHVFALKVWPGSGGAQCEARV